MNKRRFGTIGEKIAQNYLKNREYEILETNFYTKKGEIDIVSKKDNCIIFVEVKTRNNLEYGTPGMSVNFTKKKHIKNAAKIYIYVNKLYGYNVRFDVIEVIIKMENVRLIILRRLCENLTNRRNVKYNYR